VDDLPEKPAKPDKTDKPAKSKTTSTSPGVSRRDFLKISGVSAAVPLVSHVSALALDDTARVQGPGKVPVSLNVNGKKLNASLEPRVTLLDALRDHFELTGAKRVCDRGTCGSGRRDSGWRDSNTFRYGREIRQAHQRGHLNLARSGHFKIAPTHELRIMYIMLNCKFSIRMPHLACCR